MVPPWKWWTSMCMCASPCISSGQAYTHSSICVSGVHMHLPFMQMDTRTHACPLLVHGVHVHLAHYFHGPISKSSRQWALAQGLGKPILRYKIRFYKLLDTKPLFIRLGSMDQLGLFITLENPLPAYYRSIGREIIIQQLTT